MTYKGLENLAHAIVRQACMDYMYAQNVIDELEDPEQGRKVIARRVRSKNVTPAEVESRRLEKLKNAYAIRRECTDFFTKPSLFTKLYNLDGGEFLCRLKQKYSREKDEGRRELIKIK